MLEDRTGQPRTSVSGERHFPCVRRWSADSRHIALGARYGSPYVHVAPNTSSMIVVNALNNLRLPAASAVLTTPTPSSGRPRKEDERVVGVHPRNQASGVFVRLTFPARKRLRAIKNTTDEYARATAHLA